MNILITSSGRRVSLVRAFQYELSKTFPNAHVYAGDANANLSAACQVASKCFNLPRVDDPVYISYLKDICIKEDIRLIIPTIDTELKILADHIDVFKNSGIHIVISNLRLINICRDKKLTHDLFNELNIDSPRLIDKANPKFPLFVKPYDGSNSTNLTLVEDRSGLKDLHLNDDDLLFFEYLDHNHHTEFTVDMYYDKNSILRCVVPRQRIEVRGGEVNKGITRNNEILSYLNAKMRKFEGARGCITLQLFQHNIDHSLFGIEINPRFGGGYPLSYAAGANFPQWIIQEYLLDNDIADCDSWEDNLLMLRYDDEVLVHDFKFT